MLITRNRLAATAALGGLLLQGCSATPRFEDHFGAATHANLAAQVIDPAAAANANPVFGVDGPAALAAHERYQRSFTETDHGASQPMIGGGGVK